MILANVDEQYKKFPEMKREEILKLMDWMKQQPHMPTLTENILIMFYHACYYSMEMTKRTIETNLSIRTHCPEFFQNLDIERNDLQSAMRTVTILPLPKATPEGYRVIMGRLADTDASKFNFADLMKLFCIIFELWVVEGGIETGHVIVMDMKGVTLGHIARVGLFTMKKFLFYLQEGTAIRLAGFHFINIVPFMDKILTIMNPFMKKELRAMMQLHTSLESFYDQVPKEILPVEYGGLELHGDIIKENLFKKLRMNREAIIEYANNHQINEKLRTAKPANTSNLFGLEGNFKKLDFD